MFVFDFLNENNDLLYFKGSKYFFRLVDAGMEDCTRAGVVLLLLKF